jgi:hypothetical protein
MSSWCGAWLIKPRDKCNLTFYSDAWYPDFCCYAMYNHATETFSFPFSCKCKLRTYHDAVNSIWDVQELWLHYNNSSLFDTIAGLDENEACLSKMYMQKTLLYY